MAIALKKNFPKNTAVAVAIALPLTFDSAINADAQEVRAAGVFPQDNQPTILRRAGNYSQEKQVVVVLVSKGYKEELDPETKTPLTGKEIGNYYASELHHKYGVRVGMMEDKETRPSPYTGITYFVNNVPYGPYDLKAAQTALPTIANTYDLIYRQGVYKNVKEPTQPKTSPKK